MRLCRVWYPSGIPRLAMSGRFGGWPIGGRHLDEQSLRPVVNGEQLAVLRILADRRRLAR